MCSRNEFLSLKTRLWALRQLGHEVGQNVFYGINNLIIGVGLSKLILCDNSTISTNVTFILSLGPHESSLSGKYQLKDADIIVKENAWIGTGCIIYPNVTIGEESIVNAGSIVTIGVPPNTLVQEISAKPIKIL